MKAQRKPQAKATPNTKVMVNAKKGETRISPRLAVNHNQTLVTA